MYTVCKDVVVNQIKKEIGFVFVLIEAHSRMQAYPLQVIESVVDRVGRAICSPVQVIESVVDRVGRSICSPQPG